MPENNPQLARAVREWIEDRGLTQTVIAARGGPSTSTLTKVLSGQGSFRGVIFSQLDRGLGWGEGTAERSWRGESLAGEFDWREVSDQELVEEVQRRLAHVAALKEFIRETRPPGWSDDAMRHALGEGGRQDAGTAEDQETGLSAVPDLDDLAADHQGGPSAYEQQVAEQDRAAEEGGGE